MSGLCKAVEKQDWTGAATEEVRLQQLFDMLMAETNPIPVKWALHEMSLCTPQVRLPLTPLSLSLRKELRQCLRALGVLNGDH